MAGDDADIFSSMSWLAVPEKGSAINDDRHFSLDGGRHLSCQGAKVTRALERGDEWQSRFSDLGAPVAD